MTYRMNMKLPPDIRHFLVEVSGMAYSDEYLLRVAAEIARNLLSRTDPDPAAVMAALRGIRKATMPYHDARVRNLSKLALTLMRRIKKEGFLENPILDPDWLRLGRRLPDPYRRFREGNRVVVMQLHRFNEPGRIQRVISHEPAIYEVALDRTGELIIARPEEMIFVYEGSRQIELLYDAFGSSHAAIKVLPLVARSDPITRKYSGQVAVVAQHHPYVGDIFRVDRSVRLLPTVKPGWFEIYGVGKERDHIVCLDDNEIKPVLDLVISHLIIGAGEFFREMILKDVIAFKNGPNFKTCWLLTVFVRYYAPSEKIQELKARILRDI